MKNIIITNYNYYFEDKNKFKTFKINFHYIIYVKIEIKYNRE